MRRIFILCISLAMSVLAFNNCAYPEWEPEPSTGTEGGYGTVTPVLPAVTDFSIVASIAQTKSEMAETGELVWNDGDLINVFHNVSGEATLVDDGVVYYDSSDEQENVFKGKLGKKLKENFTYDWFMFYPYTADLSIVDNAAPVVFGSLAAGSQTQNGYSSAAHLSGPCMPMYGTATGVDADDTPVAELSHLSSVLKLNIASCMPQPIKITEVKITAGEEIVGSFIYDFVKGTLTPVEGKASKTAVLAVNNPSEMVEGQTETFYFVVKPFTLKAADGLKITVNGAEKVMSLREDLVASAGKVTEVDYTFYDVAAIQDSLLGKFKIKTFWVYGGLGPEWDGAGWVDLHNKNWWFDEATGHGITAELDNYIEFTLTDLLEAGKKRTGKCVNYAGVDAKNWSCFFHDVRTLTEGLPSDRRSYYRHIPIGESIWVRDLTVIPNTVTFTDEWGNVTVLDIVDSAYEFTTNHYNDSKAEANKKTFPLDSEKGLSFHVKVKGNYKWDESIKYTELDKIFHSTRDLFIDVERVDEIPAEAKTYEKPYEPTNPYPETLAGSYKYATDMTVGGPDGVITIKALTDQYATWEPAASKVNKIKNDVYTFVPTGTDDKQNEVGIVEFNDGGDGTWDYTLYDNKNNNKEYDGTELYGIIAHDGSTTYVYDRAARTITFTTRGKEYAVDYLIQGKYICEGKEVVVDAVKFPYTFGMHYDMGYETARVEGYDPKANNGFSRHYVWARHWNLYLMKQ